MSSTDRSAASHPTIVVGFGAFGLDVLRRMLLTTASRGALVQEEPRAGDDPSDRRLRDLALLHVDPGSEPTIEDSPASSEGSFEMMNDLYRQIGAVGSSTEEFSAAMRAASTRLLSATDRTARRDRLRLGLDVIVIARPTYRDLAQIVELLRPAMDELAARPNLARPGQGADRVNFIQILDFEHFWDSSQPARDLRRFLRGALDQWEDRLKEGKPTFRRIYLLDRHTESGDREHAFRVDEVALFLEFLLFEGRRDAEQDLFQPRSDEVHPLAAFGVRVFERSAGLVTRLAAARFGVAWLEYLARPEAGGPVRLAEKLSAYTPQTLREHFSGPALADLTAARIRELEERLASISPSDPDLRSHAERALRDGCEAMRKALADHVAERARDWMSGPMSDLRGRLVAEVDEALHGEHPSSIAAVIGAVAAFARDVDPMSEPRVTVPPLDIEAAAGVLARAAEAHERFAAQQIKVARLPRLWLLLSAFLTAALVPLLVRAIASVPAPDGTETFLGYGYDALQLLGIPVVTTFVVFGLLLAVTRGLFQRAAGRASRRALDFHVDPERGRIADAVRSLLDEGQPLRTALEASGAAHARKVELTVRSEVHRELLRVEGRLQERARELSWARSQLRELLKIHGVGASVTGGAGAGRTSLSPVRSTSRLDAKIDDVLASMPLTEQRFRDAQRSVKPFEGWASRHDGSLLLFPLRLLDRLSTDYRDPLDAELASRGTDREHQALAIDLIDFIRAQREFSTGFLWSTRSEERAQPIDSLCFLPSVWSTLPGVDSALQGHAFKERQALFDGRAYLLKMTLGIAADQIGEGT